MTSRSDFMPGIVRSAVQIMSVVGNDVLLLGRRRPIDVRVSVISPTEAIDSLIVVWYKQVLGTVVYRHCSLCRHCNCTAWNVINTNITIDPNIMSLTSNQIGLCHYFWCQFHLIVTYAKQVIFGWFLSAYISRSGFTQKIIDERS